jgi:hypothetical protein
MEKRHTTVEQAPKIILYSQEFGFEEFDYETLEEAEAGLERLKKKCYEAHQSDGIERHLWLVLSDWATDQDDDD